ncbi:MAG: methylated-DNA--[protein]-cysteine S-methyltransferase [Chloroflexi bacterium]|nr:methylated-DNA--[protein]-cysteine S-methyltransferase [Chloroflexota bacterium]
MPQAHFLVETRQGWVGLVWGERGLQRLHLPQPTRAAARHLLGALAGKAPPPARELVEALCHYFEGGRVTFPGPVDLSAGTAFQQSVWQALREISPGTTITYGQLAQRLGRPRAARAVGQALAANPIPIVIPCHRVVAASGRLGGYTGASTFLKAELLRLEAAAAQREPG